MLALVASSVFLARRMVRCTAEIILQTTAQISLRCNHLRDDKEFNSTAETDTMGTTDAGSYVNMLERILQ
jgi:hypothetical protein